MILIFIALLVVSIFFPPAWFALAGYTIYVFSSRKSRRDEAVESRVKKLIAAGESYSTFSDLYFDAARKYAEEKGGTSEQDYASVRMLVSDRLYSVSFMNDGGGGTNISVMDWRDVENQIERDLKDRLGGSAETEEKAPPTPPLKEGTPSFIYKGGRVDDPTFQAALDFIVSLEYLVGKEGEPSDYDALCDKYRSTINMAETAIRKFGEQIEPRTLEKMQEVYYSFTNSPSNRKSYAQISVVTSTISDCWNGIGPWQQ